MKIGFSTQKRLLKNSISSGLNTLKTMNIITSVPVNITVPANAKAANRENRRTILLKNNLM